MVVDTSALIAILLQEPVAGRLVAALRVTPTRRLSAATLVEAGIVMQGRKGNEGEHELDVLVRRLRIAVLPLTEAHTDLARAAFRHFGKGRHPAALNFGDCFSYALARALDEPLLFVGDDFGQTDVKVAAY